MSRLEGSVTECSILEGKFRRELQDRVIADLRKELREQVWDEYEARIRAEIWADIQVRRPQLESELIESEIGVPRNLDVNVRSASSFFSRRFSSSSTLRRWTSRISIRPVSRAIGRTSLPRSPTFRGHFRRQQISVRFLDIPVICSSPNGHPRICAPRVYLPAPKD